MPLRIQIVLAESLAILSFCLFAVVCVFGLGTDYSYVDYTSNGFLFSLLWSYSARARQRKLAEPGTETPLPSFRPTPGRIVTWIWLVFYLLMSAKLAILGGVRLVVLETYELRGVPVSGRVVAKDSTELGVPTFHLTYQYDVSDGESYTKRISVTQPTWYGHRKGDPIPARYLPSHPETSRLEVESETHFEKRGATLQLVLSALLFIFGTWLFAYGWRKSRPAPKSSGGTPPV